MQVNFSKFCNSKMIADQSAFQSIQNLTCNYKIDVLSFLENKGVSIIATQSSVSELSYPAYSQDLFSAYSYSEIKNQSSTYAGTENKKCISTLDSNLGREYVISRATGSLTKKYLEPNGFPVEHNIIVREETAQPCLWDASIPFQRIKRKCERTANYSDLDNFILARKIKAREEKSFIFVSDEDQIKQCEIECHNYLTPKELLLWMENDNYIAKRKNAYIFSSWKNDDRTSGWTNGFQKFKDLRSTLNAD